MSLIYGMNYEYKNNQSDNVLVFLHGWGCNKDYWNNIINALGDSCSYIKLDLYGFGDAKTPEDYFDTYEYAYRVFLVLKELGIDKIVLIGHSFGGRLSILLSSVFGLSIRHVVLTAAAGLNRFSFLKWLKIKNYKFCKFLVKHKVVSGRILKRFGSRDYQHAKDLLKHVLLKVVVQDLSFCLVKIYSPVVLYWGLKDKDTPFWMCKKFKNSIRQHVQVCLNKSAGHFVAFENYRKFATILLDLCN